VSAALRWPTRGNDAWPSSDHSSSIAFELPAELAATEPPEARGAGGRDAVRLMVSHVADDSIAHRTFRDLPGVLASGDLLVVNASATINAALDAWRAPPLRPRAGTHEPNEQIVLHLSSPVDGEQRWIVELRRLTAGGTEPLLDARVGEKIALAASGTATLVRPFVTRLGASRKAGQGRLWVADLAAPRSVMTFATHYGRPIRYSYVRERWPLSYYQTVFATEPGSAEMPSAARPFTSKLLTRLEQRGVRVRPVVLHTGVASLESHEPPYPERYCVPLETAAAVNATRATGGRVIAVGTSVVRALETVASAGRRVHAAGGWTDLVVTAERGVHAVDGLLTGFHEPRSSHLAMLEAVAGRRHVALAYQAALRARYRWHEFGDVHLILRAAGEG
jgi:S-adenosylmethionine:tRNA ribosyltransferase-isomerase